MIVLGEECSAEAAADLTLGITCLSETTSKDGDLVRRSLLVGCVTLVTTDDSVVAFESLDPACLLVGLEEQGDDGALGRDGSVGIVASCGALGQESLVGVDTSCIAGCDCACSCVDLVVLRSMSEVCL